MMYTIQPGSHLVVSKYDYGAKLPTSTHEIPYCSWFLDLLPEYELWTDTRTPALREVVRGEVCLARFNDTNFIKRIVGVPGDTLSVGNGQLIVNSKKEVIIDSYRFLYSYGGETKSGSRDSASLRSDSEGDVIVYSGQSLVEFQRIYGGSHLAKKFHRDSSVFGIFPRAMRHQWDRNNYGPFVVPYKGICGAI